MEERSAFDILLDYPKERGLTFETNRSTERFHLSTNDPILNTKYVLFKTDSILFYAFDSYAAKALTTKTFTGIYSVLDWKNDFECSVYKKDWLDSFLRKNKKKTGNKNIDRKLTITTKSAQIKNIIDAEVAATFMQLAKRITPVQLIIQDDYLPMIKDLTGKKVIGIETSQWIYQHKDIDTLLKYGGEIMGRIKANRR